jgi:hypothetical protein
VPILWESGIGSDVMKPIAAPIVGGMITSTIHVLILVPVLFVAMKGARASPRFSQARSQKWLTKRLFQRRMLKCIWSMSKQQSLAYRVSRHWDATPSASRLIPLLDIKCRFIRIAESPCPTKA